MPFLTTCKILLAYRVAFRRYITICGSVLGQESVPGGSDFGRSIPIINMAKSGKSSIAGVNEFQRYVCSVVPVLHFGSHKGQCGRIGVVGGSDYFVGAAYFASMSALRLGADLVYVFTTKSAAAPLKTYSPDLMVHPCLDSKDCNKLVIKTLPKLHSLVIGCGLSLEPDVQTAVSFIIEQAKELNLPIVIDASAFPLIVTKLDLIRGYRRAILTPNFSEFKRLYKSALKEEFTLSQPVPEAVEAMASNLGNVTIVAKGAVDIISDGLNLVVCDETGSPRRCGGQGDVLAGLLGTFSCWAFNAEVNGSLKNCPLAPSVVASLGASMVTRRCARNAFKKMRRSTLTPDILDEIRDGFAALFPVD
ncbi:ATP-dependent (S)-NAD(P)H-hydrate dehydratase-like [Tropilaelaps mercedesae]|uniref:ATP-dependent (S)-NAD(P)H-hydrate dehydratase n=1 Tax=Tropilaelaps mercedesae TaxID=418985 RepID=A0A1V9X1C0_9ACAR|nr:ATP-dependent (S)-NAD(P)H-hydrate dehydratase-like [Tropilaelaps mercedesae]